MDYDTDVSTKVVRVNRTYNVYRGTSPSTQNRLEVSVVCPPSVACCCPLSSASFCKKERKKRKEKENLHCFLDEINSWTPQFCFRWNAFLVFFAVILCIFSFQCFWITEMKESLISFYYAWRNNIFFLRKIITFTSDIYECLEKSAAFELDL